jgi:TupA-like ATPgrasp
MNAASAFVGRGAGDDVLSSPTWLAKLRIALCYLVRHQRLMRYPNPTTFTELVQRRKLLSRDARMAMLADKVAVKAFVAATLGSEWVTPTLWHGTELPETPDWPLPFVVKSQHGCNQNAFFRNSLADWPKVRRRARHWMKQCYGKLLDEWLYTQIPRGILVEPFIGERDSFPVDYKIYTFGGRATHIQVHLDRENDHRWMLFDRNWQRISGPTGDPDPAPPTSLKQMLDAAGTLGSGFDFVRCDFYEVGGKPLFGEMTFYPGSGLDKFHPISLDAVLGSYWLDAGGS